MSVLRLVLCFRSFSQSVSNNYVIGILNLGIFTSTRIPKGLRMTIAMALKLWRGLVGRRHTALST